MLHELQKYALHESIVIVLQLCSTSSACGSVPDMISLLCLKTHGKYQSLLAQIYLPFFSVIKRSHMDICRLAAPEYGRIPNHQRTKQWRLITL